MLAAVACHFNPAGFAAPERNYARFAAGLARQRVPALVVELAFDNKAHRLPPVLPTVRVRGGAVLWQKERLLNMAVSELPPEFDRVAVLDADVLLEDGWVERAERALESASVVQLFTEARYLGPAGEVGCVKPGVFADKLRGGDGDPGRCGMGLAYAFRRRFLEESPLYERGILGGGDTFLTWAAFGDWPAELSYSEGMNEDLLYYLTRFRRRNPGLGTVEGTVTHLYHGAAAGRQYADRYEIVRRHNYCPVNDIRLERGVDGPLVWASDKPGLHREVAEYFLGRKEDG